MKQSIKNTVFVLILVLALTFANGFTFKALFGNYFLTLVVFAFYYVGLFYYEMRKEEKFNKEHERVLDKIQEEINNNKNN